MLDGIRRAQSKFIAAGSSRETFEILLDTLLAATNSDYGFIGQVLLDPDGAPYLKAFQLTNIAWSEQTRDFYQRNEATGFEFRNLKTLFGAVMVTNSAVISNDPSTDPRSGGLPPGHPPLRAFMGLPFFIGDRLVGMMGVANRPGGYDEAMATDLEPFLLSCGTLVEAQQLAAGRRHDEAEIRKLAMIAARTDNGVILTDALGRIEWINEGFTRITEFAPADVIGWTPGALLQGPDTDAETAAYMRRKISAGEGFSAEVVNYSKSGRKYWIEIEGQPIHDSAGHLTNYMAVESDITVRKRAEQRLAVQYAVAQALAESDAVGESGRSVLGSMCDAFGWQFGAIWGVDSTSQTLVCNATWARSGQPLEVFDAAIRAGVIGPGVGLSGGVWSLGVSKWMRDVALDSGFILRSEAAEAGLHGAVAFPLIAGAEVVGVMAFFSQQIEEPDQDQVRMGEAAAKQVGQALSRRRAQQELIEAETRFRERRDSLLGAVSSVAGRLLRSTRWREIVPACLDDLARAAAADLAYVVEDAGHHARDSSGRSLFVWQAGETSGDATQSTRPNLDAFEFGSLAESLSTGQVVRVHVGDLAPAIRPRFEQRQVTAVLLVPIFTGKIWWGVLGFDSCHVARDWSVVDADILTTAASLMGSAIQRSEDLENLEAARNNAEIANQAKSSFLANMSHEIRTPMNAVVGMTSLLVDTPLSVDQQEYVSTIRQGAEALLAVTNDILDLSKIESGHVDLERSRFSLRECVEAVYELHAHDARKKGLSLSVSFDADVPTVLVGDVTRLRQIVANLVANAVKFTKKGSVTVSVSARLLEPGAYELAFAVRDTGIGIPANLIDRLFRPFSQVDASTTRHYGGTGLGLAISRRLCELMGGRMWVESEEGRGSAFHFTIRADAASGPAGELDATTSLAASAVDPGLAARVPLRVLLVEDNAINQRVVQLMLSRMGYRADVANNGVEGVVATARQDYDLVLMDVQMPEMDGLEATRAIRRAGSAARRPWIVGVTASATVEDREKCLSAGMNGYLSKPIQIIDLQQAIARCGAERMLP
ncbi:MAG: GAF domain-containing protein [Acidobacteriota bacterium]